MPPSPSSSPSNTQQETSPAAIPRLIARNSLFFGFVLLFSFSLSYPLFRLNQHEDIRSALERAHRNRLMNERKNNASDESISFESSTQGVNATKILYTVTTLREFNNGKRNTKKGSDRFQDTLIPILTESVQSMLLLGYEVDVYLICGFVLTDQRKQQLLDALPIDVGLEVWDDALPINYDMKDLKDGQINPEAKVEDHQRGLARQHRFVMKDKMPYYDAFVNFEDDMLVKGDHVQNYLQMSQHLQQLQDEAPDESDSSHLYYGNLTKEQLKRTIPGFIRVEAVIDETKTPIPPLQVKVPVDDATAIDPSVCCHVSDRIAHERMPPKPTAHELFLWEVQILALGVRQMPSPCANCSYNLDWALLQRGTPKKPHGLLDYWSGMDGYYRNDTVDGRPPTEERKYKNNQGGYMVTRQQLYQWHTEVCNGGFLPPYDAPYKYDGLDFTDVEYWSGGLQLIQRNKGCSLQRIINLDPDYFGKHILYHTANNKQGDLKHVNERFTRLDEFYGMLTAVQKNAIRARPLFQNYTAQDHQDCNHKEWERLKQENRTGSDQYYLSQPCLIQ